MPADRFWESKSLDQMNQQEWESLCDGCGLCCLLKIEDVDSGELFYTNVVCEYHNNRRCCCTRYRERSMLVPDCIKVTPEVARIEKWLPGSCAYRLLAEGKPLFDWHPLISGDPGSVRDAGISIRDRVISEKFVHRDELPEHLVHWFD
ncbi:MAG: YcgN family cysteine cluster protein [Gammaproteobacteria bacterium]|nr:MAG: YcgN family cysteine cluster protein [Gammaproteobacteria bacterium]